MKREAALLAALLLGASLSGCQQRMSVEGRIHPDSPLTRPPVEGTVAREAALGPATPARVTLAGLRRGQERFEIYCSPCHGLLGDGHGAVPRRGLTAPPSFHIDRLRAAPDSHFYDVITRGYGAMYSYADRVAPADRWAIASYVRALQLSQNAPLERLPPADRARLEETSR